MLQWVGLFQFPACPLTIFFVHLPFPPSRATMFMWYHLFVCFPFSFLLPPFQLIIKLKFPLPVLPYTSLAPVPLKKLQQPSIC